VLAGKGGSLISFRDSTAWWNLITRGNNLHFEHDD
jgi:hypothetical protein